MDDIGAGGSGARDLLVETPEIGSQNRRRHENPIGRQFAQVVDHNILFLFFFIQEGGQLPRTPERNATLAESGCGTAPSRIPSGPDGPAPRNAPASGPRNFIQRI